MSRDKVGQGHNFEFYLRVIELESYDIMVLGMDWLRTLSPFTLDVNTYTLKWG